MACIASERKGEPVAWLRKQTSPRQTEASKAALDVALYSNNAAANALGTNNYAVWKRGGVCRAAFKTWGNFREYTRTLLGE